MLLVPCRSVDIVREIWASITLLTHVAARDCCTMCFSWKAKKLLYSHVVSALLFDNVNANYSFPVGGVKF